MDSSAARGAASRVGAGRLQTMCGFRRPSGTAAFDMKAFRAAETWWTSGPVVGDRSLAFARRDGGPRHEGRQDARAREGGVGLKPFRLIRARLAINHVRTSFGPAWPTLDRFGPVLPKLD